MRDRGLPIRKPPGERRPVGEATPGVPPEQLRQQLAADQPRRLLQPLRALHARALVPGGQSRLPERRPERRREQQQRRENPDPQQRPADPQQASQRRAGSFSAAIRGDKLPRVLRRAGSALGLHRRPEDPQPLVEPVDVHQQLRGEPRAELQELLVVLARDPEAPHKLQQRPELARRAETAALGYHRQVQHPQEGAQEAPLRGSPDGAPGQQEGEIRGASAILKSDQDQGGADQLG